MGNASISLMSAVLVVGLATATVSAVSPGSSENLHVTSRDGISLAGTLHLPDSTGPFPVVVLLHGSEPGDRSHRGYNRWARELRTRGFATLIFDKRGVGESQGVYVEGPDLEVPAHDAIAWIELLAQRSDIDSDRIGVLGWSQGGWVGPIVASKTKQCAFVVSISGPGVSPLEQNVYDKTNQFRERGGDAAQVEEFSNVCRLVWTYLATGNGEVAAQAAWDAVHNKPWFHDGYNGPPMGKRESLLRHPRLIHFAAHSTHDPVSTFETLRVPFLAVFGERDFCTPVERSISVMTETFRKTKHNGFTYKVFPEADHGIRVRQPDGTTDFAPGYVDYVLDWVAKTAESGS